MKKVIVFSYFLFFTCLSFCQVRFEALTFDAALQRSRQAGKIIFLQFESSDCIQCNEVADKAFENKELSQLLEQAFICMKVSVDHPDRDKIALLFNKKGGSFGSLFINSDGTIIYSYPGSSSFPQHYREHIDKALTAAGEGRRIGELEKEYKAGNRYPGFIEFLLKTKESLSLETDSLLNEYVSNLPPDSFNSIRTVQFIASMSPLIGSNASNKIRQNRMLFDKAWYSMNLQERISINRRIGYKSMQKAINEKNIQYANQVASFIRSTYDNNTETGKKAYESKMLEFYRETNDTANYLTSAVYYFDTYFMTSSVDSIKLKDKIYTDSQIEKQPIINDSQKIVKRTIIYSPNAQMFTRELNNGA